MQDIRASLNADKLIRTAIDKQKAKTKNSKEKSDKPSECYIQFNHAS